MAATMVGGKAPFIILSKVSASSPADFQKLKHLDNNEHFMVSFRGRSRRRVERARSSFPLENLQEYSAKESVHLSMVM
jgi:hypothetical protein